MPGRIEGPQDHRPEVEPMPEKKSELVETPWRCLEAPCEGTWFTVRMAAYGPRHEACPFCGSEDTEVVPKEGAS